jgi:hypothetical protein
MITLTKIRDFDLSPAQGSARKHLSAASGLVRVGPFLYVIADDENHLGVFRLEPSIPGTRVRLFSGELPVANEARKALKRDLESLMLIPARPEFPTGAMLALGSGSRPNRRLGALLQLDHQGAVHRGATIIDLSPLYCPLDRVFDDLNIEGATVTGPHVVLLQRGNKGSSDNATVRFPLASFIDMLNKGREISLDAVMIKRIDLGRCNGVPFSFSDAAALPSGEIVFTAVAEDTEDSYSDGPCVGAGIGVIGRDEKLSRFMPIDPPYKVEGVDASVDGEVVRLLLVSDADDASTPSMLFSAALER